MLAEGGRGRGMTSQVKIKERSWGRESQRHDELDSQMVGERVRRAREMNVDVNRAQPGRQLSEDV